ncbi:single myb histone 4-like isoform X2 [Cornus florida]|uniref:single myb histone 4-like isoform X2 n=1 Tax=Cornus florida TaxID=4283 RepID=UPI00289D481B|nr:single myb histone 4-like isoform X2 [Cornus florida]
MICELNSIIFPCILLNFFCMLERRYSVEIGQTKHAFHRISEDKWRNMFGNYAQDSKEKLRIPRIKAIAASPPSNSQNHASTASLAKNDVTGDPSRSLQNGKAASRYYAMIFEALSTINDPSRSDLSAIDSCIQRRHPHEVPLNFRRLLCSKLRRLVLQGKLEKVRNCYKIKKDAALGAKTPIPKQKDIRPKLSHISGVIICSETVQEAATTAAYKIADAENKSFVAAEAVKEAERVSRMAEDTESLLQLVKEIYGQCSQGDVLLCAQVTAV